jgi:hypothetical protein
LPAKGSIRGGHDRTGDELALDGFDGCYNHRPMRGSTNGSIRAFAMAVDLDLERSPRRGLSVPGKPGAASPGKPASFEWTLAAGARTHARALR